MGTKRNTLFAIMVVNIAIAMMMRWTFWNRIAVIANAVAVLINTGQGLQEWIKSRR